jgi:DNA recombination-dependent growth factor C
MVSLLKVSQQHVAIRCNENAFRTHISVDKASIVKAIKAKGNLIYNMGNLLQVKALVHVKLVEKVAKWTVRSKKEHSVFSLYNPLELQAARKFT